MTQRVLVDANVLFAKTTMDWLFLLRCDNPGMFQLCATEDILAEVLANMRKKHPTAPGHVTRHRADLMRTFLDEILDDYSGDLSFTGNDPDDYHVHAAAVTCRADLLLTQNDPADFTRNPDEEVYEIIAPDEFFCLVAQSNPMCLRPIVERQLEYWQKRPRYLQLDDALTTAGCPAFGLRFREELQRLAFD
ncbi:PIN domain-containing protein [Actinomyces howellii]|uniref:PIN domain-containing protein n=1 Tax=Actinomyces howellii TaxID=52771 RepID=A0A3S4UXN3_9ACTO|nr:PIN domain-containing protein [Actinomyces howellii]VEG28358.1 Uncharacterised protein [Actinomyces howellii]